MWGLCRLCLSVLQDGLGGGWHLDNGVFVCGRVSDNKITGEKLGEFGQGIGRCQQLSSLTLNLECT